MPWQADEWDAFCMLLEEGWPGEFGEGAREAWQTMLDGYNPSVVVEALRALMLRGGRFRPSIAEFMAEIRRDPGAPTFDEMFRLVFGPRGVLRAEPTVRTWGSQGEYRRLRNAAALERAEGMHPLVASFVARQTPGRLRDLELDHPEWGEVRRKELRQAWEQHTEACEGRDVAALAAGSDGGLRKFDPLAALTPPQIPQEVQS